MGVEGGAVDVADEVVEAWIPPRRRESTQLRMAVVRTVAVYFVGGLVSA
jgi:hypothetical protein